MMGLGRKTETLNWLKKDGRTRVLTPAPPQKTANSSPGTLTTLLRSEMPEFEEEKEKELILANWEVEPTPQPTTPFLSPY